MELRRATIEDALAVFEWRNDPHTIAMSGTAKGVELDGHMDWFRRAIANPDRRLFIAVEDGKRLGMVRLDRTDDGWLVSINVAPDERGKGHGTSMLRQAMAEVGSGHFSAEIKPENVASLRLFEGCGFRPESGRYVR